MQRRDFLKLSAALGAGTLYPLWSPAAVGGNRPALPIPPLLKPNGQGIIELVASQGKSMLRNQLKTTTWGYNGALLGPALQLQRDSKVTLQVSNRLPESTTVHWHGLEIPGDADGGPHAPIATGARWQASFTVDQPAATCWFHPHPHQVSGRQVAMGLGGMILIEDRDATLSLPATWGVDDLPVIIQDKRLDASGQIDYRLDVMAAAAGWFGDLLLTNGVSAPQHAVPRGWIRLRLLNASNARSYRLATSDHQPFMVIGSDGGLLAEPVQVHELPMMAGERFEVLVNTKDGKPLDLVTLPVTQMGMTITPFDQAQPVLRLLPTNDQATGKLPDALGRLPALAAREGLPVRKLKLSMDPEVDAQGMRALTERYGAQAMAGMDPAAHEGHGGMPGMPSAQGGQPAQGSHDQQAMQGHDMQGMAGHSMPDGNGQDSQSMSGHAMAEGNRGKSAQEIDLQRANLINGQAFNMKQPAFSVKRGQYEIWQISGEGDMMLHPFHIHGTQFRILSENGKPPAAHRRGWKDIVSVEGAVSEVLVHFRHEADASHPYMAHCHVLEHEDTGMMMSFLVENGA